MAQERGAHMTDMPTRRGFCALAAALAASAVCAPLAGCGAGRSDADAEAAKSAVDEELRRLASSDGSAADLLSDTASDLQTLGLNADEFLGALLDGVSWEIGEASVQDGAGTVEVALRRRSLSAILSSFKEAYTAQALQRGGHPEESELYSMAGSVLLECVRAAKLEEVQASVQVEATDGSWAVSDEGQASLTSAFMGS